MREKTRGNAEKPIDCDAVTFLSTNCHSKTSIVFLAADASECPLREGHSELLIGIGITHARKNADVVIRGPFTTGLH